MKKGKATLTRNTPEAGSLNPQQEMFCQEYLKDLNAKQAAIRAGYSDENNGRSAETQAHRLLRHNKAVQARVQELMDERAKRVEIDADQVLRELMRIGYSDIRAVFKEDGCVREPHEWPEDLARSIASIEVDEIYEVENGRRTRVGVTKKIKFWNKVGALELMGKHLKLFTDKVEHSGQVTLEALVAGSMNPKGKP